MHARSWCGLGRARIGHWASGVSSLRVASRRGSEGIGACDDQPVVHDHEPDGVASIHLNSLGTRA